MSKVSVLIVGAGPSGLMMANELARHGISFRIIDQKPQQTEHSNAVAIQTRTVEIFRQLGLLDEFLKNGQRIKKLVFFDNGKKFAELPLEHIDSTYPFVLAVPQSSTERILNRSLELLHHRVERNRELIDFSQHDDDVEAILRHQDGYEEKIYCEWLIGCDGHRSIVRDESGITFPGEDIDEQFVVADAKMSSLHKQDEIYIYSKKGRMLGIFPYGDSRFRIAANMDLGYERKTYTEKELGELIDERSNGIFNPEQVSWISPFWIHSKIADKMRDNRAFLVGDAAHIHSPVGGQGMNTGLQDAHNLAWKLALVIQGRAKPSLLDTYEQERRPIVKDVVEVTERMTKLLLVNNAFVYLIRKYTMKLMMSIPALARKVATTISQIGIHYEKSPIMDYQTTLASKYPEVGKRAPNVRLGEAGDLYDYFSDTSHHVLCFAANSETPKMISACEALMSGLPGPFKDIVRLHLVTSDPVDEPINQIYDINMDAHHVYDINEPAV